VIIVGLDPGVRRLGYSVVEIEGLDKCCLRDLGVLKVDLVSKSMGDRLEYIHEEVTKILKQWNPRFVGLENAVNFKNVSSAFKLTEARGVIRLACFQTLADMDARLLELSPTAIKKESTGSGLGNKENVKKSLSLRFPNLTNWIEDHEKQNNIKLSHDAFDALAIAWTTWAKVRQKQRIGSRVSMSLAQR